MNEYLNDSFTDRYRPLDHHEAALASLRFYQGDREELQEELDKLQVESKHSDSGKNEGGVKMIITTSHLRRAFTISTAVLVLTLPFYPILQNSTYFFTHLHVPSVGVGPVVWFISPELVPLQYRSTMFCMCYGVHSMLVVLTNFATLPLIGKLPERTTQ
ncbi:hypothetical protein NECAME_16576 [Necator americanus]|uniref:Major facilitator superfamily (MFS) profile domain-containing protein n=1 Tax=Necator americanus TaxID=51031 RepID=W2TY04_NECAM|nr:hypothetical protein NECAME_16576 [Necator americanus]ETN85926.1 hypothetical protein NECAME_16576 [Necator americanus]